MTLSFENVSSNIGSIRDVSFSHNDNSVTCLLGNNGSGKTTLLRLAAHVLVPQTGRVLHPPNVTQAWLPQFTPRAPDISVLEYISLSREFERIQAGKGTFHSSDHYKKYLLTQLEAFDVATLSHRDVASLSGGEWQRVQLARVWASQKQLLLLDEPNSALDHFHIKQLASLCKEYRKHGSLLVATHDLNFATAIADRIVILEKGTLAWQGEASELYTAKDILMRVFGITFGWYKLAGETTTPIPILE